MFLMVRNNQKLSWNHPEKSFLSGALTGKIYNYKIFPIPGELSVLSSISNI